MSIPLKNIFSHTQTSFTDESFQTLLENKNLKLERIISKGHCSKVDEWYDQASDEWVILLQGNARLQFAKDRSIITLTAGNYLFIPAHEKHRVDWTDPLIESIWLALHTRESS